MSAPIITRMRVPDLSPGHLPEARRAIGNREAPPKPGALTDERIEDALWITRALPAALDALADTRSGIAIESAALRPMWVERLERVSRNRVLEAVARYVPGADRVEVEIREEHDPEGASPGPTVAVIRLRVALEPEGERDEDRTEDNITLRRFSVA